jgi:hypothetical protein
MFKRGAFDLGCKVCPIAIKYNKLFAETFWHSRRQSFTQHLMSLMTSWAVVADVWYLDPQEMAEGEGTCVRLSQIPDDCFISQLVTVVHTSRYTTLTPCFTHRKTRSGSRTECGS